MHVSASFLTADHTTSLGERYVHLLAAAPGTSGEPLRTTRGEQANHDKRYGRRGRRRGEDCDNDRDYYDEDCNTGRSRQCLIEEKFSFGHIQVVRTIANAILAYSTPLCLFFLLYPSYCRLRGDPRSSCVCVIQ